jgi:hypothetical protein
MKKSILLLSVIGLSIMGCMKSKTCTCKDPGGTVLSQNTKKTSSKSDLQKFEDDCKKKATVTTIGSGSTATVITTPCEISE